MSITKTIASVVLSGAVLSGCMSLEERLASNDPNVKSQAERELVQNSRRSANPAERIAVINRLTDQKLLLEIAITAYGMTEQDGEAAVSKLKTEEDLVKVAVHGKSRKVSMAALSLINSDEKLADVSLKTQNPDLKLDAFKRLKNQSQIFRVAKQDQNLQVKLDAIKRLTDKTSALEIAFSQVATAPLKTSNVRKKKDCSEKDALLLKRKMLLEKKEMNRVAQEDAPENPVSSGNNDSRVALVDEFIANCDDQEAFLKLIKSHAQELTAKQCVTLKNKATSQEVKELVSNIEKEKVQAAEERVLCAFLRNPEDELVEKAVQSCILDDTKIKVIMIAISNDSSDYFYWGGKKFIEMYSSILGKLASENICYLIDPNSKFDVKDENGECVTIKLDDERRKCIVDQLVPEHQLSELVAKNKEILKAKVGDSIVKRINDPNMLASLVDFVSDEAIEKILDKHDDEILVEKIAKTRLDTHIRTISEKIKTAGLADYVYDHMNFAKVYCYDEREGFWKSRIILANVLSKISRRKQDELISIAKEHAKMQKDVVVAEGYWPGMPVVDLIAIRGMLGRGVDDIVSINKPGGFLSGATFRTFSDGGDYKSENWKTEWTANEINFSRKERYKLFGIEDGHEGITAFVKKYMNERIGLDKIKYQWNEDREETELVYTNAKMDIKISSGKENGWFTLSVLGTR